MWDTTGAEGAHVKAASVARSRNVASTRGGRVVRGGRPYTAASVEVGAVTSSVPHFTADSVRRQDGPITLTLTPA
uniref:Uncharacterized protein n=1 Tax=Oryza sativa subsp. japonica TaxID=39947 RepID=Q6ZDF1_ORYSJ|nr:hypothetical protein [Oryza sativa Japonica Group]